MNDSCSSCGSPLAPDQRYCLECGMRSGVAVQPPSIAAMQSGGSREPARGVEQIRTLTPAAAGAIACLLLALGIGVVIGRARDGDPARAGSPQVITVAGGAAQAAFAGDWPDGEEGWTVALERLEKTSAQPAAIAAAKEKAAAAGAPDVGALDSDLYPTLKEGQYVVYSGRFASKVKAAKALKALAGDFPDAEVVQVGSGVEKASGKVKKKNKPASKAIEDLNSASPEDFRKKSRNLPDEIVTPGKAPPKDNKKPGGGSDFEDIG